MLAWPPSEPALSPPPPAGKAAAPTPPASATWPPPTRPCTRPIGSARPPSPPPWPTAAAWEQATRAQRQLAVTADAELRRRHPGQQHSPLRSAEPEPPAPASHVERALTTEADLARMGEIITRLTAHRRELARQFSERTPQPPPAQSSAGFGPAFPAWTAEARDAILQPPRPQIEPSPRILERVTGRDLDLEAGG